TVRLGTGAKTEAANHVAEAAIVAAIARLIESQRQHSSRLVDVELRDQMKSLHGDWHRKRRDEHLDRRGRIVGFTAASRARTDARSTARADSRPDAAAASRTAAGGVVGTAAAVRPHRHGRHGE